MEEVIKIQDIIKDRMNYYLKEDLGITSISNANSRQIGKAFTKFYVKDVLAFICNFDGDLIDEGLSADGSDDIDIDFIYQNANQFFGYPFCSGET